MISKKAFLLLNGSEPTKLPDLSDYDIICVTDGAYDFLHSKNIRPDIVTGDFDSINATHDQVEFIETPDQNFTDFDKALTILKEKGYERIDVYGAHGKEQDHFLGNISTALYWKNNLNIIFFDDYGRYFFIENALDLHNVKHKTISLIPFPLATGIVTEGLQYTLNNETLTFGKRIGTRNRAIKNNVRISFNEGVLLIYISH
jgi:thiamine pyrophosphokinase